MLNILVAVMLYSFWIALILGTAGLFLLRLFAVLKTKQKLTTSLIVLFLPCSIGYYLVFKEKNRFKKLYEVLVVIAFILMLIGGVMIYYTHFA